MSRSRYDAYSSYSPSSRISSSYRAGSHETLAGSTVRSTSKYSNTTSSPRNYMSSSYTAPSLSRNSSTYGSKSSLTNYGTTLSSSTTRTPSSPRKTYSFGAEMSKSLTETKPSTASTYSLNNLSSSTYGSLSSYRREPSSTRDSTLGYGSSYSKRDTSSLRDLDKTDSKSYGRQNYGRFEKYGTRDSSTVRSDAYSNRESSTVRADAYGVKDSSTVKSSDSRYDLSSLRDSQRSYSSSRDNLQATSSRSSLYDLHSKRATESATRDTSPRSLTSSLSSSRSFGNRDIRSETSPSKDLYTSLNSSNKNLSSYNAYRNSSTTLNSTTRLRDSSVRSQSPREEATTSILKDTSIMGRSLSQLDKVYSSINNVPSMTQSLYSTNNDMFVHKAQPKLRVSFANLREDDKIDRRSNLLDNDSHVGHNASHDNLKSILKDTNCSGLHKTDSINESKGTTSNSTENLKGILKDTKRGKQGEIRSVLKRTTTFDLPSKEDDNATDKATLRMTSSYNEDSLKSILKNDDFKATSSLTLNSGVKLNGDKANDNVEDLPRASSTSYILEKLKKRSEERRAARLLNRTENRTDDVKTDSEVAGSTNIFKNSENNTKTMKNNISTSQANSNAYKPNTEERTMNSLPKSRKSAKNQALYDEEDYIETRHVTRHLMNLGSTMERIVKVIATPNRSFVKRTMEQPKPSKTPVIDSLPKIETKIAPRITTSTSSPLQKMLKLVDFDQSNFQKSAKILEQKKKLEEEKKRKEEEKRKQQKEQEEKIKKKREDEEKQRKERLEEERVRRKRELEERFRRQEEEERQKGVEREERQRKREESRKKREEEEKQREEKFLQRKKDELLKRRQEEKERQGNGNSVNGTSKSNTSSYYNSKSNGISDINKNKWSSMFDDQIRLPPPNPAMAPSFTNILTSEYSKKPTEYTKKPTETSEHSKKATKTVGEDSKSLLYSKQEETTSKAKEEGKVTSEVKPRRSPSTDSEKTTVKTVNYTKNSKDVVAKEQHDKCQRHSSHDQHHQNELRKANNEFIKSKDSKSRSTSLESQSDKSNSTIIKTTVSTSYTEPSSHSKTVGTNRSLRSRSSSNEDYSNHSNRSHDSYINHSTESNESYSNKINGNNVDYNNYKDAVNDKYANSIISSKESHSVHSRSNDDYSSNNVLNKRVQSKERDFTEENVSKIQLSEKFSSKLNSILNSQMQKSYHGDEMERPKLPRLGSLPPPILLITSPSAPSSPISPPVQRPFQIFKMSELSDEECSGESEYEYEEYEEWETEDDEDEHDVNASITIMLADDAKDPNTLHPTAAQKLRSLSPEDFEITLPPVEKKEPQRRMSTLPPPPIFTASVTCDGMNWDSKDESEVSDEDYYASAASRMDGPSSLGVYLTPEPYSSEGEYDGNVDVGCTLTLADRAALADSEECSDESDYTYEDEEIWTEEEYSEEGSEAVTEDETEATFVVPLPTTCTQIEDEIEDFVEKIPEIQKPIAVEVTSLPDKSSIRKAPANMTLEDEQRLEKEKKESDQRNRSSNLISSMKQKFRDPTPPKEEKITYKRSSRLEPKDEIRPKKTYKVVKPVINDEFDKQMAELREQMKNKDQQLRGEFKNLSQGINTRQNDLNLKLKEEKHKELIEKTSESFKSADEEKKKWIQQFQTADKEKEQIQKTVISQPEEIEIEPRKYTKRVKKPKIEEEKTATVNDVQVTKAEPVIDAKPELTIAQKKILLENKTENIVISKERRKSIPSSRRKTRELINLTGEDENGNKVVKIKKVKKRRHQIPKNRFTRKPFDIDDFLGLSAFSDDFDKMDEHFSLDVSIYSNMEIEKKRKFAPQKMFYAQFVLAKKGPLARIWLAAHLEEKLKRRDVADTDLEQAINEVLRPRIKISLRTTGFLLFGICKIHNQKVTYLLLDAYHIRNRLLCLDFKKPERKRPVDRPPQVRDPNETVEEANVYELDGTLVNMQDFQDPPGPHYSARANINDITLQEHDVNDVNLLDVYDNMDLAGDLDVEYERAQSLLRSFRDGSALPAERVEGQDNNDVHHDIDVEHGFEDNIHMLSNIDENMEIDMDVSAEQARHESNVDRMSLPSFDHVPHEDAEVLDKMMESFNRPVEMMELDEEDFLANGEDIGGIQNIVGDARESVDSQPSLVLESLTDSQLKAQEVEVQKKKPRRRRPKGLLYDEEMELDPDLMKEWQSDFSDLQKPLELAAPSKGFMKAQQHGSLQQIWNNPATDIQINKEFIELYQECLVPHLKTHVNEQVEAEQGREATVGDIRESMGMVDQPEPFDIPRPDSTMNNSIFDAPVMESTALELFENDENAPNYSMPKDMTVEEQRDQSLAQASQTSSAMGEMQDQMARKELSQERHNVEESATRLMNRIESEWSRQETRGEPKLAEFRRIIQWQAPARVLAAEFYALLELTTKKPIEIKQSQAYGPIFIRPPIHNL
ncbi:unnamed protein product [Bursaphelenchus okinawaensis]|uniref:Rad21_Rec8 domain-containing protein n=1 Tax=Bursaphelenchus okinawaensis TaxID=465554 RepID=A0A811JUR8_9BILA|nr:unnamed protein product [Bursaphelenchus okinawaensis]CAG9083900.1 unnamed protein product [Bursaphelenchus okinawaensis]